MLLSWPPLLLTLLPGQAPGTLPHARAPRVATARVSSIRMGKEPDKRDILHRAFVDVKNPSRFAVPGDELGDWYRKSGSAYAEVRKRTLGQHGAAHRGASRRARSQSPPAV